MSESTTNDTDVERLEQLLQQAYEELSASGSDTDISELRQVGSAVDAIVDDHETGELVEATAVDLPDDPEPTSMVEAIQRGDEASVAKLRAVLLLSRLGSADGDDEAASIVEELQTLDHQFPDSESSTDGDTDSTADDGNQTDTLDERDTDESGSDDAERQAQLEAELESKLQSAVDDFRDGFESVREQIQDEQSDTNEQSDTAEDAEDDDSGLKSELSEAVDEVHERVRDHQEDAEDEETVDSDEVAPERRPRFTQGSLSTMPASRRSGLPKRERFSTVRGNSGASDDA